MSAAGVGWRRTLGIIIFIWQLSTMVCTLYIVYTRSHVPPLAVRSKVLLNLISGSTILAMFTSVIEISGEACIPCALYYWVYALASSCIVGPTLLQIWRLMRMHGYEVLKKQYKYGKVKLTVEQSCELKRYQKWHSDKLMLLIHSVHMLVLVLIFMPIFFTDPYYYSNNYGCRVQMPPCMCLI